MSLLFLIDGLHHGELVSMQKMVLRGTDGGRLGEDRPRHVVFLDIPHNIFSLINAFS